jgi:hypothetical protein
MAVEELFPYAAALNTSPEGVLRALRRRLVSDTASAKPTARDSSSRRQSASQLKRTGKGSRF